MIPSMKLMFYANDESNSPCPAGHLYFHLQRLRTILTCSLLCFPLLTERHQVGVKQMIHGSTSSTFVDQQMLNIVATC